MISAFFSKAKTGSIAGTMLFFVAFFIQAIVEARPSISTSAITAICLSAPAALSMGVTQLALLEGNGAGVQWDNIAVMQGNFSFKYHDCYQVFEWCTWDTSPKVDNC